MAISFGIALSLVGVSMAASPFDPDTLTLYHVNQANYTGIDNMNTADASGDAFFDMRTLLQWQQCHNASAHKYPSECSNPEQFADNLVISKVEVLSSKKYGEYGECNICINSTVPFTDPPVKCTDGDYVCSCHNFFRRNEPCSPYLGKQNITSFFQSMNSGHMQGTGPPMHWMLNLADRVGGFWYSSVTAGNCDSSDNQKCAWELKQTIKVVNATCQADNVQKTIEAQGQQCFATCSSPLDHHDLCYINCYYSTLLGEDASVIAPATSGGLSGVEITKIWTDAFDACPALPSK